MTRPAGFATAASAARAFDILTCKRALEKSRSVAAVLGSAQVRPSVKAATKRRCESWPGFAWRRCSHLRTGVWCRLGDSPCAGLQALGTNHPTAEYTNEALLTLLHTHSRDDVIYALKQCAKRGFPMEPRWVWHGCTYCA